MPVCWNSNKRVQLNCAFNTYNLNNFKFMKNISFSESLSYANNKCKYAIQYSHEILVLERQWEWIIAETKTCSLKKQVDTATVFCILFYLLKERKGIHSSLSLNEVPLIDWLELVSANQIQPQDISAKGLHN